MSPKLEIIGETGLKFFGKMTASISHEIKNALAIINESAGLLEDYTLMADRGMAIEPERLKNLSQKVNTQIRRADTIVKNMNRLAHSVDEPIKSVDLNEILELVVALSHRFASQRSITLDRKASERPVKIRTSPFLLMNLIWQCLDFVMSAAGDGRIVELAIDPEKTGAQIRFRRPGVQTAPSIESFPAEREKSLLGLLNAELVAEAGAEEIVLKLYGAGNEDFNK
jgi:signal transduction histidine kinase